MASRSIGHRAKKDSDNHITVWASIYDKAQTVSNRVHQNGFSIHARFDGPQRNTLMNKLWAKVPVAAHEEDYVYLCLEYEPRNVS